MHCDYTATTYEPRTLVRRRSAVAFVRGRSHDRRVETGLERDPDSVGVGATRGGGTAQHHGGVDRPPASGDYAAVQLDRDYAGFGRQVPDFDRMRFQQDSDAIKTREGAVEIEGLDGLVGWLNRNASQRRASNVKTQRRW